MTQKEPNGVNKCDAQDFNVPAKFGSFGSGRGLDVDLPAEVCYYFYLFEHEMTIPSADEAHAMQLKAPKQLNGPQSYKMCMCV